MFTLKEAEDQKDLLFSVYQDNIGDWIYSYSEKISFIDNLEIVASVLATLMAAYEETTDPYTKNEFLDEFEGISEIMTSPNENKRILYNPSSAKAIIFKYCVISAYEDGRMDAIKQLCKSDKIDLAYNEAVDLIS